MPEPATQSTNPFSSNNSRYQATFAVATAARPEATQGPVAAEDKGKGRAEPPSAQQPQGTKDVVAKILPERLWWLRLSKNDERTRLLFHPSDPDAFHLEHIGSPWTTNDQSYPDSCSQWLEFVCGDEEESVETSRVMAVAQSIYHIACKVSIRCKDSVRVDFEIFYDPEADQVTLKNGEFSPTLILKESGSSAQNPQIAYSGVNTQLEPGAWDVAAPDVGCTTTLLVLPRRFLPAGGDAEEFEPLNRKRSTSAALAAKRVKGPAGASSAAPARRHALPVTDFKLRQPEHPLLRLKPGQTLQLAGSQPFEEYSITRTQKLAENNSSSVWRVMVSFPGHGNFPMVAKTVRKGMYDAIAAAKGWESETRIHGKLNTSGIDEENSVRFIVQLIGIDARIHTMYVEDIECPSLAHPTWRQGSDSLFTGSRGVADRVMRDMASALHYVHRNSVAHNDIKPGNILYSDTRGAVLIDFGLSSDSPETAAKFLAAGTPWYIPPEFLAELSPSRGFPGDVWALGVVQLFLLGLLPLPEITTEWRISHVVGPKGPDRDRARETMIKWLEQVDHARESLAREAPGADANTDNIVRQMTESDSQKRITVCEIMGALKRKLDMRKQVA
ncbi:hypothetical protein RB597_010300 [Gaeumannomyces tritici]